MMLFMEQNKWRDPKIKNFVYPERVWSLVRRKVGAPLTISRAVRIAKIVDFLLNKLDAEFQICAGKRLVTIDQMFEGETLHLFKLFFAEPWLKVKTWDDMKRYAGNSTAGKQDDLFILQHPYRKKKRNFISSDKTLLLELLTLHKHLKNHNSSQLTLQ